MGNFGLRVTAKVPDVVHFPSLQFSKTLPNQTRLKPSGKMAVLWPSPSNTSHTEESFGKDGATQGELLISQARKKGGRFLRFCDVSICDLGSNELRPQKPAYAWPRRRRGPSAPCPRLLSFLSFLSFLSSFFLPFKALLDTEGGRSLSAFGPSASGRPSCSDAWLGLWRRDRASQLREGTPLKALALALALAAKQLEKTLEEARCPKRLRQRSNAANPPRRRPRTSSLLCPFVA